MAERGRSIVKIQPQKKPKKSDPDCTMPGCTESVKRAYYAFVLDGSVENDGEITTYRCRDCLAYNILCDELTDAELASLHRI